MHRKFLALFFKQERRVKKYVMKRPEEKSRELFGLKELNSVIAYAASVVLTGVTPPVCESVLEEFYGAVRKSLGRIRA